MQPGISAAQMMPMFVSYFFVFLIIGIAFAIGNYLLAKRLGGNQVLWAVLSLIPFVNYIFAIYVAYKVVFAILDRLPRPATSP